jgi:DNA-binding transcriptional ArsR family regulator
MSEEKKWDSSFLKIVSHPFRHDIDQMLDQGCSAKEVAKFLWKQAEEEGYTPGKSCPLTVSDTSLSTYVKARDRARAEGKLAASKAEEFKNQRIRTAVDRRKEALEVLDRVVEKGAETLENSGSIGPQTMMQGIQLREQLGQAQRIEVEMSAEVAMVLRQVIQVVIQEVPPNLRLIIADRLRQLPVLQQLQLVAPPVTLEALPGGV